MLKFFKQHVKSLAPIPQGRNRKCVTLHITSLANHSACLIKNDEATFKLHNILMIQQYLPENKITVVVMWIKSHKKYNYLIGYIRHSQSWLVTEVFSVTAKHFYSVSPDPCGMRWHTVNPGHKTKATAKWSQSIINQAG